MRTIFDVNTPQNAPWWFALCFLLASAALVVLGLLSLRQRDRVPVLGWIGRLTLMSAALAVLVAGSLVIHYLQAKSLSSSTKSMTITGVVYDFDAPTRTIERFSVSGVRFVDHDIFTSPGFHEIRSSGSPIRNGLCVSAQYDGTQPSHTIVRLAIDPLRDRKYCR